MITDSNGMGPADFAAMMGNGANGGMGGGGGFWFFVLFLVLLMSGRGWGGGGNDSNCAGNPAYAVQDGFNHQAVMSGINNLAQGQVSAAQAAAANQLGIYQAINGVQAAQAASDNNLAMNFQNCCCENRLGIANLGAEIAREAAAGRAQTQATGQQVMDKLCQLELDGVRQGYEAQIRGMQQNYDNQIRDMQQNFDNRFAAMQSTIDSLRNTATIASIVNPIIADNTAQTVTLKNDLNPQARPAYIVQNPNGCANQLWNSCYGAA